MAIKSEINKKDLINLQEISNEERNVALINKAQKLTRSEYLKNKTELSDEDIVRILDLPAERPDFSKIKTYTEKSYEEIKNLPELNELAEKLKAEPEYLKFRSTYIAKSKLLYQESSVLFNEIPALIILDEINEPAYLLPYGYAREKKQERSFADSVKQENNAFTEFKRVFSEDFSRDYQKSRKQGNEGFIFLNHKKNDKQASFRRLKGIVNASSSENKTYKVYFYSEQEKKLFGYSINKSGFITEFDLSKVKKSGLTPLGKPSFAETILNTSIPSTRSNITPNFNFVNNNLFNSMLEKGALIELRRNSKIKNRDERYLISLKNLEAVTNNLSDGILKKSNSQFLQSEKQSQFYKDLQKGEEKTMENVNEERNVALINKAQKLTRSEYLKNKTELSDEDIVRILDLPAEKEIRTQIKSYTDKDYLELAKDNTKLSQLTESLKNDAEYLTYRGSYIAKSKLLYESPVTLCNEIPSLLIGEEIGESFYLLPYGYAKNSKQMFQKFADTLDRNIFTDIKRNYGSSLRKNFKKAHKQGKNIFFLVNNENLGLKECEKEIKKCVYNRNKEEDKSAKYYLFIEMTNQCLIINFNSKGTIREKQIYNIDLNKIKLFTNEEPKVAQGRTITVPTSTIKNINEQDASVNDIFKSLLLRGEIEIYRYRKDIENREIKYMKSLLDLENFSKTINTDFLKSSNLAFLQSEKQTQFYKGLQKGEEKTMENVNEDRNVALNEEQKNKSILDQGIEQIQANGGMSEAAMEADIASESLDSFFYDETEDNNDSPSEQEIEAAERAYQEWEEMLDDNQKAEEIIERIQRKEPEEQNENKIQKMALSKDVLESLTEIGNTIKNDSAMILKSPSFGDVTFSTGVFGDLSKKNNGGYGINHIVEGRYVKDGLTQQDIASLLYLIKDAVETTTVEIDDSKSRQNIIKDGIWVTLRKDFDGIKQNWIITGFAENDEKGQITKEAADAIKAVNAQYGYAPEHLFVSEQVGAVIASLNNVAQNILMSSDEERIKNFKEVFKNTQFLDSVIKNENTFSKEATDTIQTVIAQNSYALEHSSIREQVGAVIDSIPLANEKSTIINNNEKSQKSHSNAKEYMIQTTRLFLSKLKEKSLPFLQGKEQGSKIIIKPQAVREALTGKAFTGYTQLMAQALIQAVYEQKKIPELEYELITYDQAKTCGTFIKKGSPHITLTNYNTRTNAASKQMYYFKSGCKSPEIIDLTRDSITRNRIIKKIRLSLSDKELTSEQQAEEKNKITLLHYKELTYLKTLKKDAEQYINSLPAEEKNMLTELCTKKPLEQKTVQELAQTLRKNKLLSTQLSSQKNSERSFDATECIVPEDFIAKAMAAASLGCSLETTEKTIEIITKNLHQTLSNNIEHYDYGKAFDVGEVINEKCIKNCKEMKNQEYEAAELVKKLEQKQQELKKNPIGILTELLNKTELSNRTIGGYER